MKPDEKNLRLLLVDDEEDFLESTTKALVRRGIEVETATNGILALEMVREKVFDVVVLDIKMPGIDGIETFQKLKQGRPYLPIIMLTGHGTISHAFLTSRQGVFDFLDKPCEPDTLAERVRDAAEHGRNMKQASRGQGTPLEPLEPIHVLLVDDEREFLNSMKAVLERRKMRVTTSMTGQEALGVLKETLIDVVVLDVKMPGMDGLEVLKRIKKDFANVEVLLLTGHPTIANAVEGTNIGAAKYLEKPPDVDELTQTIRWAYGRRQENIARQQQKIIEDIRRRYPSD